MQSEKLQSFISAHTPATVVWDFETVRSLVEKAGLEIRQNSRSDELRDEVVAWGDLSDNPLRVKTLTHSGWGFFKKTKEEWVNHSSQKERYYHCLALEPDGSLEVKWSHTIDGSMLIFQPWLGWGDGFPPAPKPGELLLQAAGLEPVFIPLPERVVWMPVPQWVEVTHWDPYNGSEVSGTYVFETEARALLAELSQEIENRIAGQSCYQGWYNNGSGYFDPDPNSFKIWAETPEKALEVVSGGFPDKVVTLHGFNPNDAASFIKARG